MLESTLCAKLLNFSHVQLCNPMDCSLPVFSFHGILQARILEWVAISSSRGSSQPRDRTLSLMSPAVAGGFFTTSSTWEAHCLCPSPGTPPPRNCPPCLLTLPIRAIHRQRQNHLPLPHWPPCALEELKFWSQQPRKLTQRHHYLTLCRWNDS